MKRRLAKDRFKRKDRSMNKLDEEKVKLKL